MNPQTRRLIVAFAVSMAVFYLYIFVYQRFFAPPPAPAQPAVVDESAPAAPAPGVARQETETRPSTAPAFAPQPAFTQAADNTPITLGGNTEDRLRVQLLPRGAAVGVLELTSRITDDEERRYVYAATPEGDEPYRLLSTVETDGLPAASLGTRRILISGYGSWRLDNVIWRTAPQDDPNVVVFQTELARANEPDQPLLRLTKSYQLAPQQPLLFIDLGVENLSETPLTITLEQDGATGIPREQDQYEERYVFAAFRSEGAIVLDSSMRDGIAAEQRSGERLVFRGEGPAAWTALTNRFFGVFVRPVADASGDNENAIQRILAVVANPQRDNPLGVTDAQPVLALRPIELAPGAAAMRRFEVYAGPKDEDRLALTNPAFVDATQVGYSQAQFADRWCMCTFQPLPRVMAWLLHTIYYGLPNYGVAIMILVVIVRTALHPLTVLQQRSMIRTSEGMARVQPKMQAIKDKYPDDKVKQNQEMMRLFAEEGVNPAQNFLAMIPMLFQMPILVALWVSLNGDIELRHAPFFGWMNDLSKPDALIEFPGNGLTIPILGFLIPSMFANIPSFNLLPILMGVGMYLQQKYMPKPAQQAQREARQQAASDTGKESTFETQMKQQQVMMTMMAFIMPIFFYYMPAGLNLYWLSTTVFGIGETLLIRKQMQREKERREKEGPQPEKPKKKGPVARFFAHIAEQAEELQRKADDMAELEKHRRTTKSGKKDEPRPYNPRKTKERK